MKKSINFSETITGFDGTPLVEEVANKKRTVTVKDMCLTLIRHSQFMGLNESELNTIYSLGSLIGTSNGIEVLTTDQYDVLKKIVDKNSEKIPNSSSDSPVLAIEVYGFLKRVIDGAEQIKESK